MIGIGLLVVLGLIGGYTTYGLLKPMPEGLAYESLEHHVENVEFLYDLTYEKDEKLVVERQIFERMLEMVAAAEDFIVMDMFLFNEQYEGEKNYPELTEKLTEALIEKKRSDDIEITVITDQINTVYGSYKPPHFEKLEKAGIDVVVTNLTPLRDANPIYSGFWRAFLKQFGREGERWITNPLNEDGPKVTLRSYFKMFNLKGNHRKVLATEQEVMITSFNVHDASGFNSNIAFVVRGEIIHDVHHSEQAVVNFSEPQQLPEVKRTVQNLGGKGKLSVKLLTEGRTHRHLVEEIMRSDGRDSIHIAMFFLSERKVVDELIAAANRGVKVQLLLDPNEAAFGNDKIGIPNRPVAKQMFAENQEQLEVRFYDTNGEQFHTKMMVINKQNETVVIGGSANFTRRSLNNYNLDTSLKVVSPKDHPFAQEVNDYYSRIWNNEGGKYTVSAEHYLDDYPTYKIALFRLQKLTRLTTF